jgi:hypothetical protein
MFFSWMLVLFIIFFAILLTGVIEILRFHVPAIKRFDLTFTFLAGIATFLISGDLYLSITSDARSEENRIAYNSLDNVQKNFLEPQRELLSYYPEGFFLYASMNPDFDFTHEKPRTFDAAKRNQVELYGAMRVFQSIEDFILTARYNVVDQYVWINGFLMWLQSPILQSYWPVLSSNYSHKAREITEKLIHGAQDLNALRKQKGALEPADYDAISKAITISVD